MTSYLINGNKVMVLKGKYALQEQKHTIKELINLMSRCIVICRIS